MSDPSRPPGARQVPLRPMTKGTAMRSPAAPPRTVLSLLCAGLLLVGLACSPSEPEAEGEETAYELGPTLAGAREALALLPYPEGAERVQAAPGRVVYAVPVEGDDPVRELAAFYRQFLPQHAWDVTGEESITEEEAEAVEEVDAEASAEDPATEAPLRLEATGHSAAATIEIFSDGGELVVVVTSA
jgi:hypothetical protein